MSLVNLFSLAFILFLPQLVSAKPVIMFSDLLSGPNSGWSDTQPNKGVVVSIWGRGFGNSRGSSYISINDIILESDDNYWGQWGEFNKPVPFLQKITFQLDSSIPVKKSTIRVTVDGLDSNEINFTVNDGRIFFSDVNNEEEGIGSFDNPWQSPGLFVNQAIPGDILYLREGIYDQKFNGATSKSVIWIKDNKESGKEGAEIGLLGYPGEIALIDNLTEGNSSFKSGIKIDVDYYTIANLYFESISTGVDVGNYTRVIGNDMVGVQTIIDGTGIIVLKRNGGEAYGNNVHGGRSENRLDHAIYITGCAPTEGNKVGWNYVHDNNVNRGPLIVTNHQENRCPADVFVKSHYIFNNVVDCGEYPSRGIGVFDLSWDGAPEIEPEPTYVYGNIVNACGMPDEQTYTSVYQSGAHGVWYNNSILNSNTRAVSIGGKRVLSSIFYNNIVEITNSGDPYISDNEVIDIQNNIFFGGNDFESGVNNITSDPKVNFNFNTLTFTLDITSPAIDAGRETLDIYKSDFNGTPRAGSSNVDIGAIEYIRVPKAPSNLQFSQ